MANAELTISFSHSIFYSTETPVPAGEIAEALLALEKIVNRSPAVLKRLVPGMPKMKVQLLVRRLESGSLYEDLIVKLIFGDQKTLDRAIKRFRQKFGINLDSKSGVVRTIILALILAGTIYAVSSYAGQKAAGKLEIHNDTIIQVGARELQLTPEQLLALVGDAVQNKNRLATDAVAVIKPAKRDPRASITFDKDDKIVFRSAFIEQVPAEFVADDSEDVKTIVNTDIHVRALDLDSTAHGWAAVVPIASPRRLPLELGPEINPDDLFGSKIISGTVEALSRRDAYGKMQLKGYRLIEFNVQ